MKYGHSDSEYILVDKLWIPETLRGEPGSNVLKGIQLQIDRALAKELLFRGGLIAADWQHTVQWS